MATLLRCLAGIVVGVLPGVLLGLFVSPRIGIGVGLLGGFAGCLIGMCGVSPARVAKLFVAMLIIQNVPGAGNRAMEWVDEDSSTAGPTSQSTDDALINWLFPPGDRPARKGAVILGVIFGVMLGGCVSSIDLFQAWRRQPGIVLPYPDAEMPLWGQAALLVLIVAIWITTLATLLASASVRRPVFMAIATPAFIATAIGLAGGVSVERLIGGVFVFATIAAGATLLILAMWWSID